MNHATLTIGTAGVNVASQLTSNNAAIRPCKLIECEVINNSASTAYCQYFDNQTTAPANGTACTEEIVTQAGLGGLLGTPRDIMGGIWVWSTTPKTLTAAGAIGSIIIFLKGGS